MSFIGDLLFGSDDAARASVQAAGTAAEATTAGARIAAGSQREALEYLKEREALPRQFSEAGLKGLAGVYGIEGGEGDQQELIDRAISSPLYESILGGREAGEESILRSAAATGGLRSGNVQEALYDYNTRLQNRALLESYNQQITGLQGLAGLLSYAPQIASGMAGIGQTLGLGTTQAGNILSQGQVAGAQAQQVSQQQQFGNLAGIANLGIAAYGAGMFSDRRLKKNITKIGEHKGFNIYSWTWNIVAEKMGLAGSTVGVMADEVFRKHPEAVILKDLFMWVRYDKLGILPGGA